MRTALAFLATRSRLVAVVAGLASPAGVHAALSWTTTAQTVFADPGRSEVAASFAFKNEQAASVTILDLQTSCGCTAATLERRTYARGESGKIDVVLRYSGDSSPVEQTITVVTSEPGAPAQELKLRAVIPTSPQRGRIEIGPSAVLWRRATADAKPQIVTLHITHPDAAIRPVAVSVTDPAFRVQLRGPRADDPRRYELIVTPVNLATAHDAVITISTNSDTFERGTAPIVYRVTAAIE